MTEVHSEEHSSLIKTPKQLVVVMLLSFIVPVAAILLLVKLITGDMHIDPNSSAMTEDAIAQRLKPVGEVRMVGDAQSAATIEAAGTAAPEAAASGAGTGEQVFNTVCQACHAAGVAGAPKTGDTAAWQPRIAQGIEVLYASAINGKNLMPAKGGATGSPDADIKAAVDLMVAKSK
ncbi:MAG: cytochrome c5 family protein [Betaproteobacteria bacterium]|jgi:cytochrome c5|nr:MAG: cytochrome c5 family protein [Betaproteobacteria bacterium]